MCLILCNFRSNCTCVCRSESGCLRGRLRVCLIVRAQARVNAATFLCQFVSVYACVTL